MNEEQIIARAEQEIAARRKQEVERDWGGSWPWLLSVLVIAVVLVFVVAPAPLPAKLLLAMGGVCALRPDHSYFTGGIQLPLEARMTGIYGGFLLTLVILFLMRRVGNRRLGSWPVIPVLVLFFASMVGDGINSTLAELRLPHLYTPTNLLRLITGLLSGIAITPFLVWLVGTLAVPPAGHAQAVVHSPWDLAAPLVVNAGYAALVLDGRAAFYYPIALVSVIGIVLVMAIGVLLVVLAISGLEGRVSRLHHLVAPAALSLLLACAILAGTAAIRWTLIGDGEQQLQEIWRAGRTG
jgi:uncharacterized membrane protein